MPQIWDLWHNESYSKFLAGVAKVDFKRNNWTKTATEYYSINCPCGVRLKSPGIVSPGGWIFKVWFQTFKMNGVFLCEQGAATVKERRSFVTFAHFFQLLIKRDERPKNFLWKFYALPIIEGGVRVRGDAVLRYFWCGFAVIFILIRGIAVWKH